MLPRSMLFTLLTLLASPLLAESIRPNAEADTPDSAKRVDAVEKSEALAPQSASDADREWFLSPEQWFNTDLTPQRVRWHPLGDISYGIQSDFSGDDGVLHAFHGRVVLPSFSPVVFGLDFGIESGKLGDRDVRRGVALGYLGLLFEDTFHPEEDSFRDLFDPERRSNRKEIGIGIEWGVVEMKSFLVGDNRTYGGFRSGISAQLGYQNYSAKAGAAVEIYTDRTLWDLNLSIGYGRPGSPIGLRLGYRNLTVDGYHGNFVTLGVEYSF